MIGIDALVVLLVLAVAAADAAFILQSSGHDSTTDNQNEQNTSPATRYATVDLGTHPSYVAERITDGDSDTLTEGNITVTDVY